MIDKLGSVTYIGNPLLSITGKLTTADQILDLNTGKTQSEINGETKTIKDIGNYYAVYHSPFYEGEDIYNELAWVLIPNDSGTPMPQLNQTDRYLWNYEIIEYSNGGEPTRTTPTVIGVYGESRGIAEIIYSYQISDSDKLNDVVNGNWETNSPATTDKYRYLWRKSVTYYTDDPNKLDPTTNYEIIGVHGERGIDANNIEYIYKLSDEKDLSGEPKRPDTPTAADDKTNDSISEESIQNGWTDEPKDITPNMPYLWISIREKKADSDTWDPYNTPTLWAVYGKSIINISEKYAIWNSGENGPELKENLIYEDEDSSLYGELVWQEKSPATTNEYRYLWKWTKTELTAGDIRDIAELIGTQGQKGIDGMDIEYIYKTVAEWDGTDSGKPQLPNPLEDNNGNKDTQKDDFIPKDWSDEPMDVSETMPYQFMRFRKKDKSTGQWLDFSGSKLWAIYGKSILDIDKSYVTSSNYKHEFHPDTEKGWEYVNPEFVVDGEVKWQEN